MHQLLADAFILGSTFGIGQKCRYCLANQGMSLNQMNIALTVLATNLLAHEFKATALLSSRT